MPRAKVSFLPIFLTHQNATKLLCLSQTLRLALLSHDAECEIATSPYRAVRDYEKAAAKWDDKDNSFNLSALLLLMHNRSHALSSFMICRDTICILSLCRYLEIVCDRFQS